MTDKDHDRALERYLDYKSLHGHDANIAAWTEDDGAELRSLVDVANLVWEAGHGAPPLDSDPIADVGPDPRSKRKS